MNRQLLYVLTVAGGVCIALLCMQRYLIDGLQGELWDILLPEDTRYAPQYTDSEWRRTTVDMTVVQVASRLGPPLDIWTNSDNNTVIMRWTVSPHDSHYRVRALVFSNETVISKHQEFYVD